jgi:hypothetical protein
MKIEETIMYMLEWTRIPSDNNWRVQATSTEVGHLNELKTRLEDITERERDHNLKLQYRIVKETKIREAMRNEA